MSFNVTMFSLGVPLMVIVSYKEFPKNLLRTSFNTYSQLERVTISLTLLRRDIPRHSKELTTSAGELFLLCTMLPTSQTTLVLKPDSEKPSASKRIPRPPNAFMLYRSDFLKRRAVPPEIEKRQQNLSRIAGQCWNMLSDTEKEHWFNQAAVVRAEHRAKYPFYKAGPFHGDTNKRSTKAKRRGSTTTSGRSVGPTRTRRTKSPYCESMFAALHDPTFSSPASQPSLIFPSPASVSPLSTAASLSPLHLPQLLSPFASPAQMNWQLEDSPNLDVQQPGLPHTIQNMDLISPEASPSPKPCRSPQSYENDFANCMPFPDLEPHSKLRGNPISQVPLTLPQSDIFPSAGYNLTDCGLVVNGFGIKDDLGLFNPSLVPSYPLFADEPNTSGYDRL